LNTEKVVFASLHARTANLILKVTGLQGGVLPSISHSSIFIYFPTKDGAVGVWNRSFRCSKFESFGNVKKWLMTDHKNSVPKDHWLRVLKWRFQKSAIF
jgi:hypothetical protein